ncbi:hypothetical protein ACSBR1_018076 [Camellia fascicularis]
MHAFFLSSPQPSISFLPFFCFWYSFRAAFSQCSLLSDRSLSGWKGWSGSFFSPSMQDEITTSLSNGLP